MGVWAARPEAKDAGTIQTLWTMSDRCQNLKFSTAGDGKKMGCVPHQLTAGSAIYPSSLTYLPLAVRDVGNDGLCSRFLVLRAGRSHVFPVSRFTNGPDPRSSLSLSLILLYSPTCCSEEFTEVEPTCILPAPRGTVHPPFPPPFAPVA